ncbi:hypothetical protein KAU85_03100, partial [Candidatus Bathyarchaeota archaeon]|nr:hypothetical protein [Candidatus Bathyarchaeota archaeon]
SMIDATTGLRAFLLFSIFIFFSIPPLGLLNMLEEVRDLNLTTYDTILPVCRTQLHKTKKQTTTLTTKKPSKKKLYNNKESLRLKA